MAFEGPVDVFQYRKTMSLFGKLKFVFQVQEVKSPCIFRAWREQLHEVKNPKGFDYACVFCVLSFC